MKRRELNLLLATVLAVLPSLLTGAEAKLGTGKDFKFPDYYTASNGVRRLSGV